jgi:hypothetical protein
MTREYLLFGHLRWQIFAARALVRVALFVLSNCGRFSFLFGGPENLAVVTAITHLVEVDKILLAGWQRRTFVTRALAATQPVSAQKTTVTTSSRA